MIEVPGVPERRSAGVPGIVPHSRPTVTAADIAAVARAMRSGQLAQGDEVRAFEAEVGRILGLRPGVAVSSGTAALHLALLGLGIGPGDEVILPSYVCAAPLHAIQYTGAAPRLADADPATYNVDPDDVRRRMTRKTRALIVPHLFGLPADLKPLLDLDVPVIEDCAQAIGARYGGRPAGSFGTVAVVSFYATKLLTTGEGGMVLSRDARMLARIRDMRDYDERRRHRLRFNYKLTDVQAALGRSQLGRLPAMLRRRAAIAARYTRAWGDLPLRLPAAPAGSTHVYHRFVLSGPRSAALAGRLHALGVIARAPVFQPLHRTLHLDGFPGTTTIVRHALSVPLYPGLRRDEEAQVTHAVRRALR